MCMNRTPDHMPVAIFLTVTVLSSLASLNVLQLHMPHTCKKISFNCKFVKLDQTFILYNTYNYIYMQPFLLKLKINE